MNNTNPFLAALQKWWRKYPPGFRQRRGLNWMVLGLTYASFYMCRYNFRWATPDLRKDFGFSYEQVTLIVGYWSWAYGIGQLVNGLFTDRIGGKRAMLIGTAGMILANLGFGAASTVGHFTTFSMIWIANGYLQAFGAPGFVKINAAWFTREERGTFSGIFGFMIQLGQVSINTLAPALLSGFALALWTVPRLHWRWLFWVPPMISAAMAVLLVLFVKETPEEAGHSGVLEEEAEASGAAVRVSLKESFLTIVKHPLIWFYAMAYACTGAFGGSLLRGSFPPRPAGARAPENAATHAHPGRRGVVRRGHHLGQNLSRPSLAGRDDALFPGNLRDSPGCASH
ncbi:MAG: hypothetical protein DME25_13050 [Verrucomicrobia bacterium]|nr:MAG: hypothetical protein DME25_13050 [Verrucomicrobiota bacterium]